MVIRFLQAAMLSEMEKKIISVVQSLPRKETPKTPKAC